MDQLFKYPAVLPIKRLVNKGVNQLSVINNAATACNMHTLTANYPFLPESAHWYSVVDSAKVIKYICL